MGALTACSPRHGNSTHRTEARVNVLSYRNITYRYRGAAVDVAALDDVSLDVEPGTRVVVLGANGSGKSTLARLANGLLLADSGDVTVDGLSTADEHSTRQVRRSVGMVFQRPDDQIVATTVEEDVAFGPENLGLDRGELRERVDESLRAVGLSGLERREPHLLSGGQKQRLAIAGAIAMRPAYLVLDEPTSMLDPCGRDDVLAIIERLTSAGRGVLHITHDLAEAVDADSVVVLDRGRVVFRGIPVDLFAETELLDRCGLELPAVARLGQALRAAGAPVPSTALTMSSLTEALWR